MDMDCAWLFVVGLLGVIKASTVHFSVTGATVIGVWRHYGVMSP
jgi:hypothetical protein